MDSDESACLRVRFPDPASYVGWVCCWFSTYSAPRGVSSGTPVYPSLRNPTFPKSNSILDSTDISARVLVTPWCSVGKTKMHIYMYTTYTYMTKHFGTEYYVTVCHATISKQLILWLINDFSVFSSPMGFTYIARRKQMFITLGGLED